MTFEKIIFQNKRILLSLWLGLAIIFIVFKGIIAGWNNDATDFNNYYVSARLVMDNASINQFYDNSWFNEKAIDYGIEGGAKFAPFTPFTPFLYVPVSFWDQLTAKRIWLVVNLILLFILPFRLSRAFEVDIFNSFLICSLFFVPISSNLNFGQAYLVLSFLLVELIHLVFRKQRTTVALTIIAFATLIKYVPVLFIGYFIQNRFIKVVFTFLAAVFILSVLLYLIDETALSTYFNVLTNHLQGDLSGQGKFAIGFQSIDALLNHLFVFDAIENPNPIWPIPVLKSILKFLIFGAIALVCFLTLKTDQYKLNTNNVSIFIVGAYILLPASASYHFLFLVLPVLFIYKWLWTLPIKNATVIFTVLLILVFVVQQHHAPNVENWPVIHLLMQFPRLWHLVALFAFLTAVKLKSNSNPES